MKAVLVLIVLSGVAQAEERTAITLAKAVEAAGKAPGAAPPAADVLAADAAFAAAGAWPNPSLRLATTRITSKLIASAAVPLPIFGTVGAARKHARADAVVARAQAALELRTLRSRIVRAWIDLARTDGDIVATSIAAQQAAELELIARGRKEAGVGADVDITVAQAAKARAEVEAAAAQRALEAASARLAGLVGWDPAIRLHAEGGLVTGGAEALETLRAKLLAHPERKLAEDRALAAASNVQEVAAERWPKIAIEAELDYDDRSITEGHTPWERTDAIVGVLVEVPLFAHVGDRTRAARAQESAARARLAVTDAELASGLFAAYRTWQAASERLDALEHDVLPAQERAAAMSAQAFREGARDLAFALQAQKDLAALHAEVNAARADAAAAFAELQLAAGEEVGRAP